MAPFTQLQLGSQLLQGMPSGNLASTFQTAVTPRPNPFMQGVGAISVGESLRGGGSTSAQKMTQETNKGIGQYFTQLGPMTQKAFELARTPTYEERFGKPKTIAEFLNQLTTDYIYRPAAAVLKYPPAFIGGTIADVGREIYNVISSPTELGQQQIMDRDWET